MTVTYVQPWPDMPHFQVPKLHRVVYAQTDDNVQAKFQRSYKDVIIDEWLKSNCRRPFYHSPGYLYEKFIEFECDEDAVMFALRWAK
jgi:hypothetical protein